MENKSDQKYTKSPTNVLERGKRVALLSYKMGKVGLIGMDVYNTDHQMYISHRKGWLRQKVKEKMADQS